MTAIRNHDELARSAITASAGERPALERLDQLLTGAAGGGARPQIVGVAGEAVTLPGSVLAALRQIVHHLAQGDSVTIAPSDKLLTTSAAASVLNISRPYLVRLLDRGEIPFQRIGSHRRIRFTDVAVYKGARDARRERAIAELTALSDEYGLYDAGGASHGP